jgi:hypothetical protein
MNSLEALQNFVVIQVPWQVLVVDIVLTAICALILKFFYIKFGQSLSNRSRLANNFVAIAVTTALVITIVKSSLALSLGLVGALSIVRFRTAIKDPEELSYLFLSIALGLGFGANQRMVTIIAFGVILGILFVQKLMGGNFQPKDNLYLNLNLPIKNFDLKKLLKLLSKHTKKVDLKKIRTEKKLAQVAGRVEFNDSSDLDSLLKSLKKTYPKIEVSLIDTDSLGS